MTGRFVTLCLLLTACAHAPVADGAFEAAATSYVFQLRGDSVDVALSLTAESAAVVVGCDRWAGLEQCERSFVDIEAHDAAGKRLEVHQARNHWRIDATPRSRVVVTYTLKPARLDAMADETTRFYPAVGDGWMHVIGHVGLLVPRVDDDRPRTIALHWRGFSGVIACSFGAGADLTIERTYAELAHAVFIAGDYELFSDGNVTLAMRPGTWRYGGHDLLATAMPVVAELRAMFRDPVAPLLIVASPLASPGATSIYGTMLSDSISLFFPRDHRGMTAPLVALLIAHEYFHRWNVNIMAPSDDEGAGLAWFTEGFAELYMRRIAYRAGRITRSDYVWHWNQGLTDYFTSPVIAASNERVRADFHSDADVRRLPYVRGELVALIVDAHLRAHGKSLDDLMRGLLGYVRNSGQHVTTETVLASIGRVTDAELEALVRRIVIDGEPAPVPTEALLPCLRFVEALDERTKTPAPRLEAVPDQQAACASVL